MRRFCTLVCIMLCTLCASAQYIRIHKGAGSYYLVSAERAREMSFSGSILDIGGRGYDLSRGDIDSITVSNETNSVIITWYDTPEVVVDIPSHVKGVTYSVNGGDVTITSTNITDEITYYLYGSCGNGSLLYNGDYKCAFVLGGLSLTSPTKAPVDIQCGKRIALRMLDGSANSLQDAPGGAHKATLYTKGHMELSGEGELSVSGFSKHAIATNEYLQIKRTTGTIKILEAASDGIHAGQYFQMNGGTLNITNNMGDAIQAEMTKDESDENNGQVIIKGGTITAGATKDDTKCIKADADITISGGTFTLEATGKGSRGIQTDGSLLINKDDAATLINIKASGDKYTDPVTLEESRCWGIKVKGNITRTAGTIVNITATGTAKAFKADGTVNGM